MLAGKVRAQAPPNQEGIKKAAPGSFFYAF
jgi:hypothetical protein